MTTSTLTINIELIEGTAQTAKTLTPNIELIDGTAQTAETFTPNIELIDGTPGSITRTINIELLEDMVQAGQPEIILNLVGAQASRLRAELFDWAVNLRSQSRPINQIIFQTYLGPAKQVYTDEFLGPKVGTGPILSINDFEYTWPIDKVGDWSASLPAIDAHVEVVKQATGKVLGFYLESLGRFFYGWVSDYEIDENASLKITGYDMSVFMARHSSFYRHEWDHLGAISSHVYQWAAAHLIPATYTLNFGPNSTQRFGGNFEIVKRFQNQSVVEMFYEINQISGNHWILNPSGFDIYIDQMGDDSGKIASYLNEDDPKSFEEGVLAIRSLVYSQSDEEICNALLPQGSNNAFGVSVELRHSSLQDKFGYYSDVHISEITFPQFGETWVHESDEIRGWEVEASDTKDITFELGVGASNAFNNVASTLGASSGQAPLAVLAFGKNITFGNDYDFAWAAVFGYKQIYTTLAELAAGPDLRFDLCPSDGNGDPDLANPVLSAPMANFIDMSDVPEVNDVTVHPNGIIEEGDRPDVDGLTYAYTPGGDKTNLVEIIFVPNQLEGFQRVPAGSYWAVVSLTTDPDCDDPPEPTAFASGIGTFVVGGTQGGSSARWFKYNGGTLTSGEWIDQGGFDPMLEISGRYNTATSIAKYPYIIMCQYAAAIDDTLPTSGRRIMYIRDNDSIQEWGIRERVVTFQNAIDSRQGVRDISPSANILYSSACTWLQRHLNRFESFRFEVIGSMDLPKPGQKMRVVFRGLAEIDGGASENVNRKYKWLDIDDLFWILSINTSISEEGISHIFEVASVPENLLDPNVIPFELIRAMNRHNNYMSEIEYGTHVGIVQEDF